MINSSLIPKTHLIEEYASPEWITPFAHLTFNLDVDRTVVRTDYTVKFNKNENLDSLPDLFLEGESLTFLSLRINNTICEPSQYEVSKQGILIKNPPSIEFKIQIENSISPKKNTSLEGLYHSGSMLCTQNEPEGFRKITYSVDRPDNMITFRVTLIGNRKIFPILLSNGNLIRQAQVGEDDHEAVWEDPFPKPTYLFAIVAGQLSLVDDFYTTLTGRKIFLKIFVAEKNIGKTDFAMSALKEAMRWDEVTFGLEYDLDLYMIVAVDDFNMGAMENKGLNIFNSKLVLADRKSATDETFESIFGVVAHEYFHNWTGNRVTLRNWFNLSLKEGLTVFRDQWFTEDFTDVSVKRIKDVLFLLEHQFPEDAGPMSHSVIPKSYVEMNNFYTVTVYEKGAEIIRMLSLILGRDGFKKGLKYYLNTYDGQGVTFEEFILSMEVSNHRKLPYFRNWYHRKGTPKISVIEAWDKNSGDYKLDFLDSSEGDLALCYPVSLALFDQKGFLKSQEILEVVGKNASFSWGGFKEKPVVSLFRNFSAPVKVYFERDIQSLVFLACNETDGFSKFFALQRVIELELLNVHTSLGEINTTQIFPIFEKNIRERNILPRDYLSYLLSMPGLNRLAEVFSFYDYEEIFRMRGDFIRLVAKFFEKDFRDIYEENFITVADQSRVEIGKRRLKNTSLYYLLSLPHIGEEIGKMAHSQQTNAAHMSEELAVLRYFCEVNHSLKNESIQIFYAKWKNESLVIDYWLTAQVSYGNDALDCAKTLISHESFNWKNPNRVRALITAFARNPLSFHKSDGSGYLFLGKSIETLNGINPQIASNLAKQFQGTFLQSGSRPEIASKEMRRLLSLTNLSRDLEETLITIQKGWGNVS